MRLLYILLLLLLLQPSANSQDSAYIKNTDTLQRHSPKRATRRSALVPGWGQLYNKQYWKVPLVYGVLAIPASTFVYNNDMYLKTKFAYEAKFKAEKGDKSDLSKIDSKLQNLSIGSLQSYRNIFRRDRDYSIMWFILAWGVNVVDATVSGQLKDFDVSDNLSFRMLPYVQPQQQQTGLSLQFRFKNNHSK